MKKHAIALLSSLIILFSTFSVAYADDQIQTLTPEVPPIVASGSTLVPIRVIAEWLNMNVDFNQKSRTVYIGDLAVGKSSTGDISMSYPLILYIDRMQADVYGKKKALDVPAIIWNGSTMVPLRFVAESLGVKVSWNGDTREITIDNNHGKKAKLLVPQQPDDTTQQLQAKVAAIVQLEKLKTAALNGPSYQDLTKSATKYKDQPTHFKGKVFQIIEDADGATFMLLDVGDSEDQELVAVMSSKSLDDVTDGDLIEVYGVVSDPYTYTTQLGTDNTVPALILAQYSKLF